MNPIFERARVASKALAEHHQRQRVLHDVVCLGEASVAAFQVEFAQEYADKLGQVTQRLDHLLSRAKRRADVLNLIEPNCSTYVTKRRKRPAED